MSYALVACFHNLGCSLDKEQSKSCVHSIVCVLPLMVSLMGNRGAKRCSPLSVGMTLNYLLQGHLLSGTIR
jgi:hypothetical protein